MCAHSKEPTKETRNHNFLSIWLHKKGFFCDFPREIVTYWKLRRLLRLTTVCVEMIESSHAFMSCWSIGCISFTHFLTDTRSRHFHDLTSLHTARRRLFFRDLSYRWFLSFVIVCAGIEIEYYKLKIVDFSFQSRALTSCHCEVLLYRCWKKKKKV